MNYTKASELGKINLAKLMNITSKNVTQLLIEAI